jgi:2-(1,2-epoxy-1,2-dihydrophenyl)acetyl-CoA isomerase
MRYTHLLLDIRDIIAFITLNRPEVLKALDLEMARYLMNAAIECDGNPDVRAVLCAGDDLKSFVAKGSC